MALPKALNSSLPTIISQFIRNSMVHGIEDSKARLADNKNPTGNISMSLFQSEDDYIFEYIDDGKGLDHQQIAKRAIQLGITDASSIKSMSKQDMTNLIFLTNFTLSDSVTEHSGRGKGMSAIKDSVAKLGGEIRVVSKPGAFTKFVVRFPKQSLMQKIA